VQNLYKMKIGKFIKNLKAEGKKEVLLSYISIYEKFSPSQRNKIIKIFSKEKNGQWYINFLEEGEKEKDVIKRKKLCALLLSRKNFGLPYNREKVKYVIETVKDLENLRSQIYEAIRETYDEKQDRECCEKIALDRKESGRRIVCGRFSRAFYIDALLLANSKLLSSNVITLLLEKIRRIISKSKISFLPIESDIQFLDNLTGENDVSIAQIKCGLKNLKDTLRNYEFQLVQKFDENAEFMMQDRKVFDNIRVEIKKFENELNKFPSRTPIYMIFFQRVFPIDAIYMGLLNELLDPFFGQDPEIENLLANGGENIYVTPDMKEWLRICDDWIEALPAYATYQIIPENGSYKFTAWVQRNILEEMYRTNAENWALNIEEVMLTENVFLARNILSKILKINFKDEKQLIERTRNKKKEIAYISALIEKSYENMIRQISEICEREKLLRFEGLTLAINEVEKGNLVKEFLKNYKGIKSLKNQLEKFLEEHCILELHEKYLSLVDYPKRNLPSIHILTTLGPGESELNVKNWLEESMLLFNIIRRHKLEEKVKGKMEIWRQNIIKIGEKIIKENNLEGEIYKLGEGEQGILKCLFSYPEIGKEVSKIIILLQKEGENLNRKDFKVKEPECVLKCLENINLIDIKEEENLKILKKTREDMIRNFNLEKETKEFLKNYLNPTYSTINAQKEVIVEENLISELSNPLFRYEAEGPFKRYNLLYTPSRVDLGAKEVFSVRDIPKWVGGIDDISANSGKELYRLYNIAGPTVVPSTRVTEFLKVGENFFSRGGVYYLSLAGSINLDTLGMGDFEFFRNQWNARGDRKVLPAGETYGGFCVPKEFSLLYAIIIACVDREISSQILSSFGIPEKIQEHIIKDLREVLGWRAEITSELEWEEKATSYLFKKYPEYFGIIGKPICLSRLPQIAKILGKMGLIENKEKELEYKFTYWVNKKAQGLEEINRTGPFRKVKLIYQLIHQARKKNPYLVDDSELIGVMTANYKEGEKKDGKLIPVSDVRFSAGSRKLEIYSNVADNHILLDIDPEGREIIKEMFKDFIPPADIRIVGSCTGSDILNHVPNSGLEQIKNEVENYLLNIGIDENIIRTNCLVYGGNLKRWIGIKDRTEKEKEKIIKDLEGKIHLLVIDKRGPFSSYEEAIQGIDFIDLGIPDPELLELVDNLPKMLYLMKKGRPNSGLVFADGTSGARRPTFAFNYPNCRRKVKELFALEEKVVYGCLGIGKETIEKWKNQLNDEKSLSEEFLTAILNENKEKAGEVLNRIKKNILIERKFDDVLREERDAKNLGVWNLRDRYITDTFAKISKGIKLNEFDFGKWIIYGGSYIINGKLEKEEISELREKYRIKLKKLFGVSGKESYGQKEIDFIVNNFLRSIYHPPKQYKYREISTGLAGSLKAVEEKVEGLARWEERKKEIERVKCIREKKRGFLDVEKVIENYPKNLSLIYGKAKEIIGKGTNTISPYDFGKYLRISKLYLEFLNKEIVSFNGKNLLQDINNLFSENVITDKNYLSLVTNLASSADVKTGNYEFYNEICAGLELIDISLLIEKTINLNSDEEFNTEISKFFDLTVNNHIFDSLPYHYSKERSSTFEKIPRDKKFQLACQYHRYLYTYLRSLISEKTSMKKFSSDYTDLYLGNFDKNIYGIGIRGENKDEDFWFHYVRLRDSVVLKYEGFGYPEIIMQIDPADLSVSERVNLGIIYPYGNTTVPVALQQGPILSTNANINLFLTSFPIPELKEDKKVLTIREGMFYPNQNDIKKLREKYKKFGENENGLVFGTFKGVITLHGIFFHFTHPLRSEIDTYRIPIIQPLIWEAATHLKCELPKMLKGSGVKTPEQENWYIKDTEKYGGKSKNKIKEKIYKLARKYDALIVKPEKESGGRKSLILPVKENGKYIEENIDKLVELTFEISKTDNVVIQQVLESRVRQLYSKEFLEKLVERFARIGVPVLLDREPQTPLYSYFRQILVFEKSDYKISHHITVISTQGIANVGQGGLLFEYTDDIINPKYRNDMRIQITKAAFSSMESQRKYLKKNWKYVLNEYLKIYPEFMSKVKYDEIFSDLTGFKINDIPYEMGDYMPVFLIDEDDNLKYIFDEKEEKLIPLYDEKGNPTKIKIFDSNMKEIKRVDKNKKVLSIPLFNEKGEKRKLYDKRGNEIPSLVVYKIEPNPGAGLWRPHNDQLPPERKGEGVFIIFKSLGERAKIYKERLESK